MPTDIEYMQLALEEARAAAAGGEVPIGAILVHEEKIIARSGNRTIRDNDPTAHAEIVVIREASHVLNNYRLSGASLYVTLEPCAMCAGAMIQARVTKLIYGAADPRGGAASTCFEVLSHPLLNHRVEFVPGVLAEESASLLQAFFTARR